MVKKLDLRPRFEDVWRWRLDGYDVLRVRKVVDGVDVYGIRLLGVGENLDPVGDERSVEVIHSKALGFLGLRKL